MFLKYFDVCQEKFQKFFNDFICFVINYDFSVITFRHTHVYVNKPSY